jgi:NAD-dependent dihydropyrimidine dehydrogenase PreA subunit
MTARRVPRERIPWYPTVDAGACTGCRVCHEYCQHGVYVWDVEKNIAVVERPFNCLVGCSGCEPKCPAGAISFPDHESISDLIRKLREELRKGG